jgi:hypothetical protein
MKTNLKHISKILTVILISLSLTAFLSSCKKDSSNPADAGTGGNGGGGGGNNTVTLNGDGFSNTTITITYAAAGYESSTQTTGGSLTCSNGISITFYSPGQQTGTFNFSIDQNDVKAGIILYSGSGQDMKIYMVQNNSGSITINNYGSVGQQITGSFTGKIYNVTTQAEVTISGSFSAIRGA